MVETIYSHTLVETIVRVRTAIAVGSVVDSVLFRRVGYHGNTPLHCNFSCGVYFEMTKNGCPGESWTWNKISNEQYQIVSNIDKPFTDTCVLPVSMVMVVTPILRAAVHL